MQRLSVIGLLLLAATVKSEETLCSKDVSDLRNCLIDTYGTYPEFDEVPGWRTFNTRCLIANGCVNVAKSLTSSDAHSTAKKVLTRSQASNLETCIRETDGNSPKREVRSCSATRGDSVVEFHKAKTHYERHRDATYGFVLALNKITDIIAECDYLAVAKCVKDLTNVNVVQLHIAQTIPKELNPKACKCFASVPTGQCREAVITRSETECSCTKEAWEAHRNTAIKCASDNGISSSQVEKYIDASIKDACYDEDKLPLCM